MLALGAVVFFDTDRDVRAAEHCIQVIEKRADIDLIFLLQHDLEAGADSDVIRLGRLELLGEASCDGRPEKVPENLDPLLRLLAQAEYRRAIGRRALSSLCDLAEPENELAEMIYRVLVRGEDGLLLIRHDAEDAVALGHIFRRCIRESLSGQDALDEVERGREVLEACDGKLHMLPLSEGKVATSATPYYCTKRMLRQEVGLELPEGAFPESSEGFEE